MSQVPSDSLPAAAPAAATFSPGRRPRLLSRLMLATTLVLGMWIGWQEAPREVGRWYLAAAAEHRLNAVYLRRTDQSEEAERLFNMASQSLEKAIHWYPDSAEAYLVRSGWRATQNQLQPALEDCDKALELGANRAQVLEMRSRIHLEKKDFQAAVKDQLAIYHQLQSRWWLKDAALHRLNEVAYFRAVGKLELPVALEEINLVLKKIKRPVQELDDSERQQLMACLDTRGYILYLLGQHQAALKSMNEAGQLAEVEFRNYPLRYRKRLHQAVDRRVFEMSEPSHAYNLGVIFYHRSLVLQKLEQEKAAQRDRELARKLLGREPDESVF